MKIARIAILATLAAAPALLFGQDDFDVAAAYGKECSKCHAEDGSGLTKKGRKLRLKDYRDAEVQAKMTDEEMTKAIKEGVTEDGEETMNAYAETFSDAEIAALVAYVRAFAVK